MGYELEDQLPSTSSDGDHKALKAFYPMKTIAKGTVIEGVHQGRFESKAKPGYFFHVFKAQDDEAYAYGTCQALDDRIKEITTKQDEIKAKIYAKITFNGRIPSKKNPNLTYYSFSAPVMFPVKETVGAAPSVSTNTDDIPF